MASGFYQVGLTLLFNSATNKRGVKNMAKFCNNCGKPLEEGQPCPCTKTALDRDNNIVETIKKWLDPASAGSPVQLYERDMAIVPDCVSRDENEVPLRQYNVATLRSRLKLEKAEGRIQVTNKRVLFRAKGTSLPGKTLLQYEFDLLELSGIEARSNYKFSLLNFFIAVFLIAVGATIVTAFMLSFKDITAQRVFGYIFGIGSLAPFFLLKKKSEIKFLCLGASFGCLSRAGVLVSLTAILIVVAMVLYVFVPNLVITFKTKGGSPAVDIRAKKRMGLLSIIGIGNGNDQEFTGLDEVLPAGDKVAVFNEVAAMINDLRTMGNLAIEKWKR